MKYGRWTNGRLLDLKYLELAKIMDYLPKKEDVEKFEKQLRIAFTVGLKINKKAVVRNRLRRQIREVVRLLVKENKLKNGYYLLFVARKDVLGEEYTEIEREVKNLLEKAKII